MRRTVQPKTDRTKTGQFAEGNTASKGKDPAGKAAGRKTNAVKAVLHELLFKAEGDDLPLVEVARNTIRKALSAVDDRGHPNLSAVHAARDIWDRAFGKPRQTMDVKVSNVEEILSDLTQDEQRAELEDLNQTHHNGGS